VYFIKTPKWLPLLAPKGLIWEINDEQAPSIYLTFDDGPHPLATPFVLDQLKSYQAKASFFCIGKNIVENPEIFNRILTEGHSIGHHTHNHFNGWHTETSQYLNNYDKAATLVPSNLFRPPYGRITREQAKKIQEHPRGGKIFMWTVLSGDFDIKLSPEKCLKNVLKHLRPGSIVVFHDSAKAWDRMSYCLPSVLDYCQSKKWALKGLKTDS